MPGLGHVNSYALEDADGLTLVDPGLPSLESWNALGHRLAQVGADHSRVHTAVVTHSHPDHFGGVHRLRDDHGTRVLTHADFRSVWTNTAVEEEMDTGELDLADDEDLEKVRSMMKRPTPWGATRSAPPAKELRKWSEMDATGGSRSWRVPEPSDTVIDGEEVVLGGRIWLALHTPGHTPGSQCFHVEERDRSGHLVSGDTLFLNGCGRVDLPGADPKAMYESLETLKALPDSTNLFPGHLYSPEGHDSMESQKRTNPMAHW